ncbi:DAK2 domain-containing protein [Streptomyces meridianus]|uniref:DAK2 domain-containing protein n=1 Tax=Streptomyces meridianus TaxID=2938945 RepID=A0ABT0X899_9ACTN|nr:DAK2 domain-containing protein [Streptomyces meridianus]MCM2578758.1 DAK2 domain-containing protein [Streptomyces meridianus]
MPHTLDAPAVRDWCRLALDALGRGREEIDAINVYPIADGDTGTNLYLTVESAARAVDAVFAAHTVMPADPAPALTDVMRAMAHGALIGAQGNSGTILAQLLRGMADVLCAGPEADDPEQHADRLRRALRQAVKSAYLAVAHPVEGTVLTVAAAAADAAEQSSGHAVAVVRAAHEAARVALEATPDQLDVLGRAGVVDAGGCGLVTVLNALVEAVSGESPMSPAPVGQVRRPGGGTRDPARHGDGSGTPAAAGQCEGKNGPAYEVIYLLEADDASVTRLRERLDPLGDSLVVVGGDGLWNVHIHVDDAGAAVEAGIEAGRPYRIRVTHFAGAASAGGGQLHRGPAEDEVDGPAPARAVVSVLPGEGLTELCREAGAAAVTARPGEPPASGELVQAIRRTGAREVVLLPNDPDLLHPAAAAAEQARADGVRVALIPTRSAVQGIAALAVHEPGRRFDEDVVAMTAAAGGTRCADLVVAERQSWTMAGVCQAGDVLGLIDGDVAVIGADASSTAETVIDRMLAAGGEMVTLVLGSDLPAGLADRLEGHVRERHLAVDTVVYHGGQQAPLLLIGVE